MNKTRRREAFRSEARGASPPAGRSVPPKNALHRSCAGSVWPKTAPQSHHARRTDRIPTFLRRCSGRKVNFPISTVARRKPFYRRPRTTVSSAGTPSSGNGSFCRRFGFRDANDDRQQQCDRRVRKNSDPCPQTR